MAESRSLFSLTSEYAALAEKLSTLDLDEQSIQEALEHRSYEIEVKAAGCAHVYLQLRAVRDGIKTRIQQMEERKKNIERQMDSLASYMQRALTTAGITKLEHPDFRIAVRDNPEHVVIDMAALVPDEFLRIPTPPPPELDKAKIKEAIKRGTEVPGAHLERTRRLVIE